MYNLKIPDYSSNYYFDDLTKKTILDTDKTINFWNNYIKNDEALENIKISSIVNKHYI